MFTSVAHAALLTSVINTSYRTLSVTLAISTTSAFPKSSNLLGPLNLNSLLAFLILDLSKSFLLE
jgi:hypothetical protein